MVETESADEIPAHAEGDDGARAVVDEVRAAAIELAVAAAEKILREKASGAGGLSLIDQSIRELKGRLN